VAIEIEAATNKPNSNERRIILSIRVLVKFLGYLYQDYTLIMFLLQTDGITIHRPHPLDFI